MPRKLDRLANSEGLTTYGLELLGELVLSDRLRYRERLALQLLLDECRDWRWVHRDGGHD